MYIYGHQPIKLVGAPSRPVRDSDPDPIQAAPFGLSGVGLLTAHPVGLLVVVAVLLISWTLPEARWFIACSLPLGLLVGLVLWLRGRHRAFASPPSLPPKSN
jgi:hypothetical protein